MTAGEERARLIEFISGLSPKRGLQPDGDTLALDSLALLQVVMYLERQYRIRLAEHRIEPDDLRSLTGLLSVIERFG